MARRGQRLTEEQKEKIRQAQLALHKGKPKVDPVSQPSAPQPEPPSPTTPPAAKESPSVSPSPVQESAPRTEGLPAVQSINLEEVEKSPEFNQIMEKYGLKKGDILYQWELDTFEVMHDVEQQGYNVNIPLLNNLMQAWESEVEDLTQGLQEAAGVQELTEDAIRNYVFNTLKVPIRSATRGGAASIAIKVLEPMVEKYPELQPIIDLSRRKRVLAQARTLKNSIKSDGKVYTQINQFATNTGRIYTENYNIQNTPEELRQVILPPEGFDLVEMDYKANEYRILAALSEEPTLCEAFRQNKDVHTASMAKMMGIPESKVTPEMRKLGKIITFAVLYGGTAQGMASTLGVTKEKAQEFIDKYYEKHGNVREFAQKIVELAHQTNEIYSLYGRRSKPDYEHSNEEGQTFNFVLQATAADQLKQSISNLKKLEKEYSGDIRIALPLHDSIMFFVRKGSNPEILKKAKSVMEITLGEGDTAVKMAVDSKRGSSWGALEKVEV